MLLGSERYLADHGDAASSETTLRQCQEYAIAIAAYSKGVVNIHFLYVVNGVRPVDVDSSEGKKVNDFVWIEWGHATGI